MTSTWSSETSRRLASAAIAALTSSRSSTELSTGPAGTASSVGVGTGIGVGRASSVIVGSSAVGVSAWVWVGLASLPASSPVSEPQAASRRLALATAAR